MLKARERVQQINEARRAREEDVTNEPGPVEDDDGPQVAGEATLAMNDVLDLHQNDESDGPSLDELVQSLNTDQARVYDQVKSHLEHQLTHGKKQCSCADFKPLQMFVKRCWWYWQVFPDQDCPSTSNKDVGRGNTVHTVCRHRSQRTGSIQCRWCHDPSTAATAH